MTLEMILGGIAAALVACILSFGGGVYAGHHWEWLKEEAAVAVAATAVVATDNKESTATEAISADAAKQDVVIQTVTKTIIRKVPVYVTKQDDARCTIPAGFISLHDAAASGVLPVPDPAGQPDAPAAQPVAPAAKPGP